MQHYKYNVQGNDDMKDVEEQRFNLVLRFFDLKTRDLGELLVEASQIMRGGIDTLEIDEVITTLSKPITPAPTKATL